MYKLRTTIFSLAIFILHFSYAQEAFDLSDCLVYTLNNSPKLQSEKLAQQKETAEMFEQKSTFLPQIDAFINYHNYFNDLPTYIFPQAEGSNLAGQALTGPYPVPLGLPHNLNTGLEINQTIFDMNFFGNQPLQQHYQTYNEIKLSMAEEEVLYQVANLFYQVAVNEERLGFLDMNLERLDKLQQIVKLQVEQGFAKQTDFDKLLVKTSNLQSNKNKLQSGIGQQVRYLKLMMGMPQDNQLQLQFDQDRLSADDFSSVEKGEVLEQKMLQEQKELHQLNANKINANYYPKLQAYAALLFQAQRQQLNFLASNQDWYNIHQWGLKLSIPIMHGFEKKTKKEISEIVDAQLTFGLEQRQEQSEVEFQNAVAELEVARAEQQSQAENVALAERVYKQSELSYGQGTMLLMDFLDSEATLRESKMIYATAMLDTRLAELKILKASGKLKELVNQ
jgi:outer membrane protein